MILLEDCGNLQEFAGWVKEGIDEIQGLDDFWRISILNDAEEEMLKGVLSNAVLQDEKGSVCFYIIEDSMEDMGLVRSIEKNFGRILILLSEYVKWSQKSEDDYLLFGRNV